MRKAVEPPLSRHPEAPGERAKQGHDAETWTKSLAGSALTLFNHDFYILLFSQKRKQQTLTSWLPARVRLKPTFKLQKL